MINQFTLEKIILEQELSLKHEKCLKQLQQLRKRLETRYKNWYIAIDPDSKIYMFEKDLMQFYDRTKIYFPQILDLHLYRLNEFIYIGKI